MADDYARHALSQRAAFEATHPAVMAAAHRLADEPVLLVADLGAADGVNSYDLIRDLAQGARRPAPDLALVDLPTNAWGVAAGHVRHAFAGAADERGVVVSLRRATPAREPPIRARAPITPRQRPTAMPAAERSSTTRLPPR